MAETNSMGESMGNRIIFINGSPRKNGNTRFVARLAMEAAQKAGADVQELDATRIGFKAPGCIGCRKCQEQEAFRCTLDDELGNEVARLVDFDVIVLASPIYWFSYTAQIKMVVDRTYSLTKFGGDGGVESALTGKTMALLATGGGPLEDNLELFERQLKVPAQLLGIGFAACLFPNVAPDPNFLANTEQAHAKAVAFGEKLAAVRPKR